MTRTYQSYDERLGPAKTKLALHQPRRALFGWYCDWCAERCPRSGCEIRQQALQDYRKASDERDRAQAVQDGYLFSPTEAHAILNPQSRTETPIEAPPPRPSGGRFRRHRRSRKPSSRPRSARSKGCQVDRSAVVR